MKIYVITKGTYSDYHICAVSEDKEKAKKLQKFFNGTETYNQARIEEYETDFHLTEIEAGYKAYYCYIYNDGNFNVGETEPNYLVEDDFCVRYNARTGRYYFYVLAKDRNCAKKIAFDKVAEYKAKNLEII